MRDEFIAQLYQKRHSLNGVALVQGLKALESFFQKEKSEPEKLEETPEHSLLERIHALPVPHAISLLEKEIARLTQELVAHEHALEEMKEIA